MTPGRRTAVGVGALVSVAAFLPFVRGLVAGESLFARDLTRYFFPLRRFLTEGLLKGELRYWNPYVHEGEALALLPIGYPVDLLQLLRPDEVGFSVVLALHVPLAALGLLALARGLGAAWPAAAAGALVYALGGFCVSSLNLYVHVQAMAWAPLVVLTLGRAALGGARDVAVAALVTALALSTTAVEIVIQAVAFGALWSLTSWDLRRPLRLGAALLLAGGLIATTTVVMRGLLPGSERELGFPPDVVLAFSVHPMTLLQVAIAGLYGDLTDYGNRFWGGNFSPGYPYFPSLYLGAAALSLAVVGVRFGGWLGRRLLVVALLATVVAMGPWGGLGFLVEQIPALRSFRFPSKAFFSVHLAVALLAALGLDALLKSRSERHWRLLGALGVGAGGLLVAAPSLPWIAPAATRWFVGGFFPPSYPWERRVERFGLVLADAQLGGLLAASVGLLGVLAMARRMPPARAALAVVVLLSADLLRTSAGLNATVTPSFFTPSAEMIAVASQIRESGGRLFTCEPDENAAVMHAMNDIRHRDVWLAGLLQESLTPMNNLILRVPTAYTRDLTMLVPMRRVLPTYYAACGGLPRVVGLLRQAAVSHVLSPAPLDHPDLDELAILSPRRTAPVSLHLYSLAQPLPLRSVAAQVRAAASADAAAALSAEPGFQPGGGVAVEGIAAEVTGAPGRILSLTESAGTLEARVEAEGPTVMVVRDAWAPGWSATVNGAPARVLRADGRHRAVEIGPGVSTVRMRYRPPGLAAGLIVMLAAVVVVGLLIHRSPRPWVEADTGERGLA